MINIEIIKKENQNYYNIVKDILENKEFLRRKDFIHHGDTSLYDHCLNVSFVSYKLAKKFKGDKKAAAIGGLLHDFYYNPWLDSKGNLIKKKTAFFKKHGFVHAKEALENSCLCFPELMNERIEDSIKKHMFPLNIAFPKYKESWIVVLADKYISLEVFKKPKKIFYYIGIGKRSRNE